MLEKKGGRLFNSRERRVLQSIHLDWNKFKEFLRSLGVEMEGSDTHISQASLEEPIITLLQKSHDHEALYRVDFLEMGPELLVLIPTNQVPLKFHFYLVKLSETHPLGNALTGLMEYQGSAGFEQRREMTEWQLFYALVEVMKALFWVGQETSHFPSEIIVQKIC